MEIGRLIEILGDFDLWNVAKREFSGVEPSVYALITPAHHADNIRDQSVAQVRPQLTQS